MAAVEIAVTGTQSDQTRESVEQPVVSILVKALNEADHIERCLRSCLGSLEGISGEVIVADSLSDDETVQLALHFPVKVVQLRHRRDRGCGVGAQLGYQHARGKYLYIMDGDMELPPEFLRRAIALLEREPRVAGVAGQLEEIRPDTDLARIRGKRRRPSHAGVGPVDVLSGGGLYRREAIEDAGGYLTHPSLHACEELELALRLKGRGWSLVRLADVSMRHSGHADPAFGLLRKRWRSRYAFGSGELLRLSMGKPCFGAVIRKFPFHLVAWLLWVSAAVSLALASTNPWFAMGALAASCLPVLAMMIVKRSAYLGLYAVVGWHVFAAGAVAGAMTFRRANPKRLIEYLPVEAARGAPEATAADGSERPIVHSSGEGGASNPAIINRANPVADAGNPYGAGSVRKGLLQFMSGRIYTGVVQFGLIALYVRYMTVEDYAAYTTYSGLGATAASLTLLGLERAAMRYYPEARLSGSVDGLGQLVRTLMLVRLALVSAAVFGIVAFSGPLLRLLQLDAFRGTLASAMLLLVGLSITRYQRIALQSLMLQRELTIGLVAGTTTRLLVALAVIASFDLMTAGWGLGAMAIGEWLQAALQWRAYRAHVRKLARTREPGKGEWRPDYRVISRYALVNGYSSLLRQLSSKNALVLIGATYLPPTILAAFGFFQALGERVRPYLPVFLSRTLIEPVAMAHYLKERDFAKFTQVMSVALKLNLLVIAPLISWLASAGTPALGALTGGKFMSYSWVLLIIVIALISTSHLALLELTANAIGQSALLAKSATLAAVLAAGFLILTQPWAGVFGLAITGLTATLTGNAFIVWRLRSAGFDYRLDYGGTTRLAVNAIAGALFGWGVAWLAASDHALAGSMIALGVGLVGFVLLGLVNRPFTEAEWGILLRLIPRKMRRKWKGST